MPTIPVTSPVPEPRPDRPSHPVRERRFAMLTAVLALPGTGVLAGAAVFLGFVASDVVVNVVHRWTDVLGPPAPTADPSLLRDFGPLLAVFGPIVLVGSVGVLLSLLLLHVAWRPLARRVNGRVWPATLAVASAAGALPVTLFLSFLVALVPYDRVFCASDETGFCGLGLVFYLPTAGAVVPWTAAGLPGLILLLLTGRGRSRSGYASGS